MSIKAQTKANHKELVLTQFTSPGSNSEKQTNETRSQPQNNQGEKCLLEIRQLAAMERFYGEVLIPLQELIQARMYRIMIPFKEVQSMLCC